jgi:hypothetical protein
MKPFIKLLPVIKVSNEKQLMKYLSQKSILFFCEQSLLTNHYINFTENYR